MTLVTRIADLQRFVRSRCPSSGRLGASSLLLVAVASVSSCKAPDGSGLLSMLNQTPVPADYANKAWKVKIEGCSYMVAFDNRSIRTDLMQCGDKVAFNSFKTVVSATEFGLRFTSVDLAKVSCKAQAKEAAELYSFYAEKGTDGSLSTWRSNEKKDDRNVVVYAPIDPEQIRALVEAASDDGTACVN